MITTYHIPTEGNKTVRFVGIGRFIRLFSVSVHCLFPILPVTAFDLRDDIVEVVRSAADPAAYAEAYRPGLPG